MGLGQGLVREGKYVTRSGEVVEIGRLRRGGRGYE